MKYIFYTFLISLSTVLWAEPVISKKTTVIDLKLSTNSNHALYAKELLIEAYALIDHEINWVNLTSSQELELVNNGRLAAAIARSSIIESQFPKLVKIPYELFDFSLLRVSDRRRCGYCLNEDIESIVYPKGAVLSVSYAESLRDDVDKLGLNSSDNLNEMILKRRADSVLIMNFLLAPEVYENPDFIVETITHKYDYHYLSPKYKHLAKPLLKAFQELDHNGTVAKLQQKYSINSVYHLSDAPKEVSFISGTWDDYSNADSTGGYWDIIEKVFNEDFSITKNTSIWARAIHSFEQDQIDVLVGAYKEDLVIDAIFSSYHIDYEYPLYAFARNDKTLVRLKEKDATLTACIDAGSSLRKHIAFISKGNIVETSFTQCETLLKNNKIDIVIEYDYNLEQSTLALPRVVLIESSPLFLVFHNTPKGHFLKSYFDQKIAGLARKGILKSLFPDEYSFNRANIRP
jgi:ABC-type amino acid transport substrate-binding protein